MLLPLLILFFYIAPATISYFGIRYQYSNEWRGLKPDLGAFAMILMPLLNWGYAVFTILNIMFSGIEKILDRMDKLDVAKKLDESNFSKRFFNVK